MAPPRSNHSASVEKNRSLASIRDALKQILIFLGVTAAYIATSKLGFTMAFVAEQVTVVWPPTGIALAAILLFGARIWPAIALGAFLTNVTAHEPSLTALGITAGNTLEALAGAWMLRRTGFDNSLSRIRDILALIFFSALLSTMVSATIGTASLCLSGLQHWESYDRLWITWWLGDAGGALIVAPFILAWAKQFNAPIRSQKIIEGMLLTGGFLLTCIGIFIKPFIVGMTAWPYLVFPFLIWASLRFGQRGTTFITLTASGMAIWATLNNLGPFASNSMGTSLMLLESFMVIVAITGLFLGAAISERRKAEDALREGRGHLRQLASIVESSDDAIISMNLNGIINSWNAGAEQLYGYIATEAIGKSITLIIPADRRNEESQILSRIQKGERIDHYETKRLAKDGRLVPISLTISPVYDQTGLIIGASKVARDITTHIELIAQLQESDRRKDEFLATLAHELRNPLAPIRNALNVMRLSKDHIRQKEAQSLIERQLAQMVRLVDDLMDVSRITRGKVEMRKETILLEEVIASAVEMAKPLIEERGQSLSIKLPPGSVFLNADPMRLAQIFANLLNNAAKYTSDGGTIELEAVPEDEEIVVAVRDNGIGIAKDMLPHIFDMFMQTDNAVGRTQGGLGIGLTLVKNLVTLHGGSVSVKSEGPEKGSEFTVRLPAFPARKDTLSPPRTEEQDNRAAGAAAFRVLIVDDNKDSAQTLGWMMELLGHEPHIAHDGAAAVALAERLSPDVILLDIGLPGMNGYDVCKIMKQNPALKNAIFIAQTGWSQAEYIKRSKEAGFDHHLVKPLEIGILRDILESLTQPARQSGEKKAPPKTNNS